MIVIAFIAYIFWSVLGLIFWMPLLVRVIAGFCISLVYHMVVNSPERINDSKISLELAISFYPRGFRTIHSALYDQQGKSSNNKTPSEFRFSLFLKQIIWTVFFWGILIYPFFKSDINQYIKTFGYTAERCVTEAEKKLILHDTSAAIILLNQAIIKDEYNADFYYKRGLLFYSAFKYKNALYDLETASQLDTSKYGQDPILSWKIGQLNVSELKDYEKAISYFSITIKHLPQSIDAYCERGLCYMEVGKNDLAMNDVNSRSLKKREPVENTGKTLLL